MVAVVSGSGLGLFGSSLSTLGAAGIGGNAGLGRGGDRVYVNSATGNLIVQSQDEVLASLGLDVSLTRTYNSQGLLNDDNGDNWRLGVHQQVYGLVGTLNTAGSTIIKVFGDGREAVYRYDAGQARYVSTDGEGAHDTLTNSSGTWTWTDGSSRNTETYDSAGRLTQSRDADGNTTTYAYTGSLLTQITDASGQTTHLDYTGNNLTQIRVVSNGQIQTLTHYSYDASNRLQQVRVDLSPSDNSISDNNVYTTTYTYDGDSRRIASITQTDGSSIAFGYNLIDGEHRLTSYTDALGRVTTLTYSQVTGSGGGGGTAQVSANTSELTTTGAELPPYYEVKTGDTWESIAQDLYGSASLADALKAALGNPSLSYPQSLTTTPQLLEDSATGVKYVRGSSVPVAQAYYDANNRLAGTKHTDNSVITYEYDQYGNFAARRRHAQALVDPLYSQDFSLNTDGLALPSGSVMTRDSGNLLVTMRNDSGYDQTSALGAGIHNFDDYVTYRGEVTTLGSVGQYFTYGVTNYSGDWSESRWHVAQFLDGKIYAKYGVDGVEVKERLGNSKENTTYVVELVTHAQGTTLYIYEKGTSREFGYRHDLAATASEWGSSRSYILTQADQDNPVQYIRFDNVSETTAYGALLGTQIAPISDQDDVERFIDRHVETYSNLAAQEGDEPHRYTIEVPEGASQLVVNLHGLGGGDADLWLSHETPPTEEMGDYHTITSGSFDFIVVPEPTAGTWHVAVARYEDYSDVTLKIGYDVPQTDSQDYAVRTGDTWSSISWQLYGTTALADELQAALGNLALQAPQRFTNLPATLEDQTTTINGSLDPDAVVYAYPINTGVVINAGSWSAPEWSYTIPSAATWQSLANTLYGVNSAAAGSALQAALGDPPLTAGTQLENLPATLSGTATVPAYYTVRSGDTWASITQTVYGTNDSNAVAALQSVLGNPTLSTGLALTVPLTLSFSGGGGGSGPKLYLRTDVQDALGQTTTYFRDSAGQLTSLLSPTVNGARLETRYTYDADGNTTSVTEDPAGLNRVTSFGYDTNGNLLNTRDSLGNTVTRTYNSNNQLLTETQYLTPDPDGAGSGLPSAPLTTHYAYDSENHLRFVVSPEGRVIEHRYNAAGQCVVTLKFPALSAYSGASFGENDLSTWVAGQSLSSSERTEYVYDWRGSLSSISTYDDTAGTGEGLLSPATTRFVYDQRGQLLQQLYNDSDTPNPANSNIPGATTYTYDGLGRVLSSAQWQNSTLGAATTLYSYDDANRGTSTTLANGLITTSTYSQTGQLTSIVQSASGQGLGTTQYAYDENGRLRIVTNATGARQFYFYDEAGRKTAEVDGDGSLTEFIYDRASQLIKSIRYAGRVDSATLASLEASGNPTSVGLATVRDAADGDPGADRITRNIYDNAGRRTHAIDESGAVTEFSYDGAGLLVDEVRYATPVMVARTVDQVLAGSLTITTSGDDRHTRHFYDGDGNLRGTLDGERYLVEYRYDSAGHLVETIAYANQVSSASWQTDSLEQLRPAVDEETAIDQERDQHHHYFYNGRGLLVGELDAEGALTAISYDARGDVSDKTRYDVALNYVGRTLDAHLYGNQMDWTTAKFTRVWYTRDGSGRVTGETKVRGSHTQSVESSTEYTYDAAGNLLTTVEGVNGADARTTQVRRDALGRVVQELSAEGYKRILDGADPAQIWDQWAVSYQYDGAGRRISATSKPNDTQTNATYYYYYDEDGHLRFEVNASGEVKENRYNAFGQLTDTFAYTNRISTAALAGGEVDSTLLDRVSTAAAADATDPSTYTAQTSYTYTLAGRVETTTRHTSASAADDSVVTSAYNTFGEVRQRTQQIDATGSLIETWGYDRRGLLTDTHSDPGAENISDHWDYDAFGRATAHTDARGNITRTEYDRLGRQVATIDALGNRRGITYDAFGRTLTTTDALNPANTTTYSYDDVNRRMTVTTPEGISVVTEFTEHEQVLRVTSAGNVTSYTYDKDGQIKSISDSLGLLETRRYDRGGRLDESENALGVITKFSYDAANRVLKRTEDPGAGHLGLETTYTYDGQGRVTRVDEPGGKRTDTTYDRAGRVVQVAVDPAGLNLRTRYAYDRAGQVITVTEGYGSINPSVTEYRYDVLGRRTQETLDPGTGTNATTGRAYLNLGTQYEYDANGNLTRRIDANNNSTWYVYDADNRLTHSIDALGAVTRTTYDNEGRIVSTLQYATALSAATMTALSSLNVATTANFAVTANAAADRLSQSIYDRDGRERYTIDAEGAVIQRTLDAAGRVTRTRAYSQPVPVTAYATEAALTTALTTAGASTTAIGADDQVQWVAYDVRGRAIYSIDGTGAVVRSVRDAAGNVVSSTAYATLRATSLATDLATLDAWADAAAIANHIDNRTTRHWYDAADREVFKLNGEGYLTETRYDDTNRRSSTILYSDKATFAANATTVDVSGSAIVSGLNTTRDRITTSERDAAGRMIRLYDALSVASASSYEEYSYDAVGNRTSVVDPRGIELTERDTEWAREERHNLGYNRDVALLGTADKVALRARYTTKRDFDAIGREISVTDPFGSVTSKTYDSLGNLVKLTDPRGNSGYYYYDATGRVRYQIDPRGYVTEKRYDALGNVTDEFSYARALTGTYDQTTEVQQLGTRIQADSARDRHVGKAYDRSGAERVITYYGATIYTEEYQYNAFGQKSSFKDRNNAITEYRYDARGRLKREIFPQVDVVTSVAPTIQSQSLRPENQYDYNAFGEKSVKREVAGATQRETRYYYDHNGREARIELPAFIVISTGLAATPVISKVYDAAGNLVLETAPNQGRTVNYYDSRNLLVASVDADNVLREYQYDSVGNLTAERAYDMRVSALQSPNTRPAAPTGEYREMTYFYDANNRREESRTRLETLFSYAMLGYEVDENNENPENEHDYRNGYYEGRVFTTADYDANGNVVLVRDGNNNPTYYYYDAGGNRILQVDALGYVTKWDYTAQGQVERETRYANGLAAATFMSISTNSQPETLLASITASAQSRVTEYDYDVLGRKTRERKLSVEYATVNATTGQMTQVIGTVESAYEYDGNGNLKAEILPGAHGRRDYDYDALGRQTRVQGAAFAAYNGRGATISTREQTDYQYDAFGNVVVERQFSQSAPEDRVTRHQYDAAGNMRAEIDALGVQQSYEFDISGNVKRKTRQVTDVENVTHTYRTYYSYDALNREYWRQDVEDEGTVSAVTRESIDVRYNAHGDIEAKGINGQYQEQYKYDRLGRLFYTNKENGTPRLYLYDANGNAVVEMHAIDISLEIYNRPADMLNISPTQVQYKFSKYDKRNQLTDVIDPPMDIGPLTANPSVATNNQPPPAAGSGTPDSPITSEELPNQGKTSKNYVSRSLTPPLPIVRYASGEIGDSGYGPSSITQDNHNEYVTSMTLGTSVDPSDPVIETNTVFSEDGLSKTVTDKVTYVSTVTTLERYSDNLSVLKTVKVTTDVVIRDTIFTRTSVPTSTENSVNENWTFKTEEIVSRTTDEDVKKDLIEWKFSRSVSWTYKGSDPATPTTPPGGYLVAISPSPIQIHALQTDSWDGVIYELSVTVGSLDSYGPGSIRVEMTNPWGETTIQDNVVGMALFEGQYLYSEIRVYKGGRLIFSDNSQVPLSTPTVVNGFLRQTGDETGYTIPMAYLAAQPSNASSARLQVNGCGWVYGTLTSMAGVGTVFLFNANVPAGAVYEYVVDRSDGKSHQATGNYGAGNQLFWRDGTYSVTQKEHVTPLINGIETFGYTPNTPSATEQGNYLRWLTMAISQGATIENIIHRKQTYNAFGEIETQIDGNNNLTRFEYNDLGNLITQIAPTDTAYNELAVPVSVTPTTRQYYDELGQLVGTQDANSELLAEAQKYYSTRVLVNGRVAKEFDALGNSKRYVYDRLGNLRQEFNELGRETEYQYDLEGQLTRVNRYGGPDDPSRNGALFSYDEYEYDEDGNRTVHTNALDNAESYVFDGQGRVVRHRSFHGRDTVYSYEYQLDMAGSVGGYQITTTTDGVAESDSTAAVTDTMVDRKDYFGRLRYHRDLGEHEFTYEYNLAGWLKKQAGSTAVGGGRSNQNIEYTYYGNGYVKSINDLAISSYSEFQYDKNGNRLKEVYAPIVIAAGNQSLLPYQVATAEYDHLNRLVRAYEPEKFDVRYTYDAVGNRRSVVSTYTDALTPTNTYTQSFYYKYDKMNRFTLTMGQLSDGPGTQIVRGTTGFSIEYDAAGRRLKVDSSRPDNAGVMVPIREEYTYDPIDTVHEASIYQGGTSVLLGKTVRHNNAIGEQTEYEEFDAYGVRTQHKAYGYDEDSLTKYELNYVEPNKIERTTYTHVGNGILQNVVTDTTDQELDRLGSEAVVTLTYQYEKWDDYKNKELIISGAASKAYGWQNGTSTFDYDSNGHIKTMEDSQGWRTINYLSNQNGQVLKRYELNHATGKETVRKFYFMNGIVIGDAGTDQVPSRFDYAQELAEQERKLGNGGTQKIHPFIGDRINPVMSADFDQNYQPINSGYPDRAPQSHVVAEGESLSDIALGTWGDASLWYLLAEANGLTGHEELVAGTRLTVPNVVTNIHNNATTFRPIDPSLALGDTNPTLPAPPPLPLPTSKSKKGCGGFGSILMIVVAIVATVYTAGAAASAMSVATGAGSGMAATFSAGASVLTGGAGFSAAAVGAGVIGGAVGSVVSQGLGIAMGMQKGFDWKGVALGAIGAGATAGLGAIAKGATAIGSAVQSFATSNPYTFAALNGAASSALTQGISVATGLQSSFDWRNVAISAVAAPVSTYVGGKAGDLFASAGAGTADFANRAASGIGGSLVRRAFGSREDSASIIADAFGSAIGSSIVSNGSAGRIGGSGIGARSAVDELSEVRVTAQRISPYASGSQLSSSPSNGILAGSVVSPDEQQALLDEVLVSGRPILPGEDIGLDMFAWLSQQRMSSAQRALVDKMGQAAGTNYQWRQRYGRSAVWATDQMAHGFDELTGAKAGTGQKILALSYNPYSSDAAMMLNDLTPVGPALGFYNLAVKTGGGFASIFALPFGGMDGALGVQSFVNRAQIHLPSMAGQMLSPALSRAQSWSENHFGDGATTLLGAGLELTADTAAVLVGGAALRGVTAEVGIFNRPLQSPLTLDLQPGTVMYSGIPIKPQSIFAAENAAVDVVDGSARLRYMGATPDKFSRTGGEVLERMRDDGLIVGDGPLLRGNPNNLQLVTESGQLLRIDSTIDMAHRVDAVSWWNSTGRFFGAKSPEVRQFMLDSDNYILQPSSINRTAGAQLGQTYQPPAPPIFTTLKR